MLNTGFQDRAVPGTNQGNFLVVEIYTDFMSSGTMLSSLSILTRISFTSSSARG
jgi:hypothetical protein